MNTSCAVKIRTIIQVYISVSICIVYPCNNIYCIKTTHVLLKWVRILQDMLLITRHYTPVASFIAATASVEIRSYVFIAKSVFFHWVQEMIWLMYLAGEVRVVMCMCYGERCNIEH